MMGQKELVPGPMEQGKEGGDDQLKHWELTKEEGIAELPPTVFLLSEDTTTRYEKWYSHIVMCKLLDLHGCMCVCYQTLK